MLLVIPVGRWPKREKGLRLRLFAFIFVSLLNASIQRSTKTKPGKNARPFSLLSG
jgi:hypothetical protein